MFGNIQNSFSRIFKKWRSKGKLTEEDLEQGLLEIKKSLLEADVNYDVVKKFIEDVKENAIGQEILFSLNPGQMIVKVVYEELIKILGKAKKEIYFKGNPSVIMLLGLQGSGKTTTAGKLANFLKKKNRKTMLVPADTRRPGAVEQLRQVAEQAGVGFYKPDSDDPVEIVRKAPKVAYIEGYDTVIVDTQGRLHVDTALMQELKKMAKVAKPSEKLFVADGMTGQDAVKIAKTFDENLNISGVILTKLDGDARGGAALSIFSVTNKPIKLIGVGEKLTDIEQFYPDRIASRILGMGDVLTLIEKAEENFKAEEAKRLEQKLRKAKFNLEDFLAQIKQIKNMGPLGNLAKMIPGMPAKGVENIDDKVLVRIEAIINSMTREERLYPEILNGSRRKRIATGSGTSVQEINQLMKQFDMMKKMMKSYMKSGRRGLPF